MRGRERLEQGLCHQGVVVEECKPSTHNARSPRIAQERSHVGRRGVATDLCNRGEQLGAMPECVGAHHLQVERLDEAGVPAIAHAQTVFPIAR